MFCFLSIIFYTRFLSITRKSIIGYVFGGLVGSDQIGNRTLLRLSIKCFCSKLKIFSNRTEKSVLATFFTKDCQDFRNLFRPPVIFCQGLKSFSNISFIIYIHVILNIIMKITFKGPAQKNFKTKFKKHPRSFY